MQTKTKSKTKSKRWVMPRHKVITFLLAPAFALLCRLKYHIRIVRCKELQKRQCLVVMNHQTAFDQFFISLALYPRPVYFIASEDLFSNGFVSKLLRWAVAPIPIRKQTTDVNAVMNCLRVAKEGGTIALAPEGNRTFSGLPCYSNPAITSLIKKLHLPIAIFRIEGGFGIQPRWSDVCRKGSMRAYVSRIIEPEEYQDLSKDALYDLLQKEMYVDETQNAGPFHHKKLAEYLERAMYVCPWCGLSVFESHDDVISCKHCGRQIRHLPDQTLSGIGCQFPFQNVAQWYQHQCDFVNKLDLYQNPEAPLYHDTANVSLVQLYKNKKILAKDASIVLYHNRIQAGDMTLFFSDIQTVTVLGKNKLNIYHKDALYQLKGGKRFNALKYMNIFFRSQNQLPEKESHFLGI